MFDLAGTESESNADVLGGHVVPASPDDRFRNRPPIYPYEAAVHGEHGAVMLIIHVSEAGVATGVDVVESSGVASLDQAAKTAVRKWRFRPALQEGRAVPFDMPFQFVFEPRGMRKCPMVRVDRVVTKGGDARGKHPLGDGTRVSEG